MWKWTGLKDPREGQRKKHGGEPGQMMKYIPSKQAISNKSSGWWVFQPCSVQPWWGVSQGAVIGLGCAGDELTLSWRKVHHNSCVSGPCTYLELWINHPGEGQDHISTAVVKNRKAVLCQSPSEPNTFGLLPWTLDWAWAISKARR